MKLCTRFLGVLLMGSACGTCDVALAQLVGDGFAIYTTDWDREPAGGPYNVRKWTYSLGSDSWSMTVQPLTAPLLQSDAGFTGRLFDMGMDLTPINGTLTGIFTASTGSNHFPSDGTEFQQRTLNGSGEWATVSGTPVYTTPANISPLGVDIYRVGNAYRMTWVEDSDVTSVGTIYDQPLALTGGVLSLTGSPTTVHTQDLEWGTSHAAGGLGGMSSVTTLDWDHDGDADVVFSKPFYGDVPVGIGLYLAEQTAPGVYAAATEVYFYQDPGSQSSDYVRFANIDGDSDPDFLTLQHNYGEVLWLEKSGGALVNRGVIVDLQAVATSLGSDLDHVFGLYANEGVPIWAVPGDVNFDGLVNIFDINLVSSHWGETGPDADANGDMIVNIFDINLISSNWSPPPAPGGGAAVPEPASWVLLATGVPIGIWRLRRCRRISPQT